MRSDTELLRLFLAAADTLNFREAAALCHVSPQAVTRAVQALETRLGEVLFHRSTRGVRLSDFALHFQREAQHTVSQLDGLFSRRLVGAAEALEGTVRVAAPTLHGRHLVMPVLARLTLAHPGLQFDLRLSDDVADAVQERVDVGLHGGRLKNSRLVVRPVAPVPQVICAAPALLQRIGLVRRLRDLDTVPTTQLLDRHTGKPWPWMPSATSARRGRAGSVPGQTVFTSDDPVAECQAVLAGLGVGQLSASLAAEHLRSGALVELLSHLKSPPWPLTVYRARREPVSTRVRLTFDALVHALTGRKGQ